jgi:hypothetical protein
MKTNLIALGGRAKSGKNTVASMIQQLHPQFEQVAFATKLKQTASILTGIPIQQFEDRDFKESYLQEWGMTVRSFMQKLGTDAMRFGLHEDVWVKALFADYNDCDITRYERVYGHNMPIKEIIPMSQWIVCDTRFPNELQAVKARGGVTIRLTRGSNIPSSHISETALDHAKFDYIIDNENQSLEETFEDVKLLMEVIG